MAALSARQTSEETFDAGALERPVRFGAYELLGRLARGGMAEVYLARGAAPSRLLAIKCMRGHLAGEERFVEMFVREGRLAMLLQHDAIVRTVDVGEVDGRSYIAMDYIGGKDLNVVLRQCQETGRRVPIPLALHIAATICEALHYAHELRGPTGRPLNIVNRDVSPSNVRLSYAGTVQLLDFGIAQALLQATSEIGILKGKFAYMSPEQVRGLPVDRRTDIFSLGIVLHETLCCERLFRDDSEFVLMEKVRSTAIRPPSSSNKRVPPELDALVMRALERDPQARFADAGAMGQALRALLERYRYDERELKDWLRGLFVADERADCELTRQALSRAAVPTGDVAMPAADPPVAAVASGGERRPASRPRRRHLLWGLAGTLLVLAAVMLLLALR